MQEARPSWHSALSRSLRSSEPVVTANRAQLGLAHQALTPYSTLSEIVTVVVIAPIVVITCSGNAPLGTAATLKVRLAGS